MKSALPLLEEVGPWQTGDKVILFIFNFQTSLTSDAYLKMDIRQRSGKAIRAVDKLEEV